MAEAYQDVYLPCLLDRLTDDTPEQKSESRSSRGMSVRDYKSGVLRDIDWLLNTSRTLGAEKLADFPHVRTSVLNYGVPDVPGLLLATGDVLRIEAALLEAIRNYEPRLLPNTVRLTATADQQAMSSRALVFSIHAELWSVPFPEELFIKTAFDLEMDKCSVESGGPHGR